MTDKFWASMARIRKFVAYRRLERPYTRKSKYRKKDFIRAAKPCKVIRFDMGNLVRDFKHSYVLTVDTDLQIRDNALEAARQTCNRVLEKTLGKNSYHLKLKVYPHHYLRENPLASGAGADRMSTGMKMSFGKVIGVAARLKKGQELVQIRFDNPNHINTVKLALKRASQKFPCSCHIKQIN